MPRKSKFATEHGYGKKAKNVSIVEKTEPATSQSARVALEHRDTSVDNQTDSSCLASCNKPPRWTSSPSKSSLDAHGGFITGSKA